jgi:hypothetical protein
MRVFYMTSTKWANVILKERRLKLARFGELNDPFELSLIDNRPHATRRVVRLVTDHSPQPTFSWRGVFTCAL